MELFRSQPDQAHALSPFYDKGELIWKPVEVLEYDLETKKFKVRAMHSNAVKEVQRLSLLFLDEDQEAFKNRVKMCKTLQSQVEAELRFTDLVDSISSEKVSVLLKETRYNFLKKSMRDKNKYNIDKAYSTFKYLIRIVEEEYIRQMKKCIVLKDMTSVDTHDKYKSMKIPIRLPAKTVPYSGVVVNISSFVDPTTDRPYNYIERSEQIRNLHWCTDPD